MAACRAPLVVAVLRKTSARKRVGACRDARHSQGNWVSKPTAGRGTKEKQPQQKHSSKMLLQKSAGLARIPLQNETWHQRAKASISEHPKPPTTLCAPLRPGPGRPQGRTPIHTARPGHRNLEPNLENVPPKSCPRHSLVRSGPGRPFRRCVGLLGAGWCCFGRRARRGV